VGLQPAAAHSLSVCDGQLARLQAEKCFFTGKAGKKTDLILFRSLRRAKLCEAICIPIFGKGQRPFPKIFFTYVPVR
jgi:hypothetical protein